MISVQARSTTGNTTSRPNIIIFLADDVGWNNVQWHNPDIKTPHSMNLLKEGIELDRHYAFLYCSPSRSSLMTGRLPFHVQQFNRPNYDLNQGAHRNFTFISRKLKSAGYQTHHLGKWHLGMSSWGHIPKGRGFDTSLAYFEGGEDPVSQRTCADTMCFVPVNSSTKPPKEMKKFSSMPFDFWEDTHPARSRVGSGQHSDFLFNDIAIKTVEDHDPSKGPMFMYYAGSSAHTPLEPPQRFLDLYPEDWYLDRRQYAALCTMWDEVLFNLTSALKSKGMWENTILLFSSDNGGPVYWSLDDDFPHGAGANNWPLLGGKVSNWEGGVRVASFLSGGLVPQKMYGRKLSAYIHFCDWYATFCSLAGVDPEDKVAEMFNLPPIDSINQWPILSGETNEPLRTEIPISVDVHALIQGDMKYLEGIQVQTFHQGNNFPNSSRYGMLTDPLLFKRCPKPRGGCLFNITADPSEEINLAESFPELCKKMSDRVNELRKTAFQTKSDASQRQECYAQIRKNNNFFGPWLS
eukprot:jgi/Bigna1/45474/e_gw1.124.1.1